MSSTFFVLDEEFIFLWGFFWLLLIGFLFKFKYVDATVLEAHFERLVLLNIFFVYNFLFIKLYINLILLKFNVVFNNNLFLFFTDFGFKYVFLFENLFKNDLLIVNYNKSVFQELYSHF